MPPDAGGAGEARGGRVRKWPPSGIVAVDWAEMRVLQWFHGVCPQKLKNGRFVRSAPKIGKQVKC